MAFRRHYWTGPSRLTSPPSLLSTLWGRMYGKSLSTHSCEAGFTQCPTPSIFLLWDRMFERTPDTICNRASIRSACANRHRAPARTGALITLFSPIYDALRRASNRKENTLVKIKIRASLRSEALEQLDSMNINAFSLFGSEESLVRTVARREYLFRQ